VVLAALKGATLGGLLTLVVVGGMHRAAPSAHPGDLTTDSDAFQQVIASAVTDHRCSSSGLGSEEVASSALIRDAQGEVRQVSFEVGWAVYSGTRPGTLIAVCLDDTRGNELVQVSDTP
jgi:hypothetical protein